MPILSAFPGFYLLLKLYRPRRFSCAIVHHSIDVFYFVDNPGGDGLEHVPRKLGGFCCHEVAGQHCPQGDGVIVGPEIAHHSDAAHIRQSGEVLAEGSFFTILRNESGFHRLGDLLAVDGISILDDLHLFLRHLADDPDAERCV